MKKEIFLAAVIGLFSYYTVKAQSPQKRFSEIARLADSGDKHY